MHNLIIVQIKTKWNLKKLLEKDWSVSVLHRNIRSHLHTSPEVVTDIFTQTMHQYNFRHNWDFRIPSVNTVYHGFEGMSYLGPKILQSHSFKNKKKPILLTFSKKNSKSEYHNIVEGRKYQCQWKFKKSLNGKSLRSERNPW